jgi:hypothetical protein
MIKYKWSYVASGHYSTPETGGWTVHVLRDGAVYKTHPSRATVAITGSKADKYIESAQTKFPVRGKRRVEPDPEPKEKKETPRKEPKPTQKLRKKVTKKQISAAAKKFAKGAGAIIGTTRAFVTEVGEAEERTYAERKAPPITKKVTKKKAKPPANGRPTIVRKKKPSAYRVAPLPTEHPLEYLMSGEGAMPPTRRKPATKRRREPTLEEYLGF